MATRAGTLPHGSHALRDRHSWHVFRDKTTLLGADSVTIHLSCNLALTTPAPSASPLLSHLSCSTGPCSAQALLSPPPREPAADPLPSQLVWPARPAHTHMLSTLLAHLHPTSVPYVTGSTSTTSWKSKLRNMFILIQKFF